MRYFALPLLLAVTCWQQSSYAQQCGETYVTRSGDDLYTISQAAYGDERKWSALYYANQSVLGNDPGNVAEAIGLRIPCLNNESAPDPTPFRRLNADLKLLSGGDYAPFTDQDLPGGGLITELVNAAFENSPSPVTFSLTWEDEWSRHLSPLLQNRVFDVGFPWFQPNCDDNQDEFRCSTFHFSEPLFEMLIPLYYDVSRPIKFESDADIEGKSLCRPKGYFTHDLERKERRWLSENKIEFVQADTIDECFAQLTAGEIDAVTINEFTGRLKIQLLGLEGKVVAAEKPLSIEGLHVLISKSHPRGTTFLYRFNAGLSQLMQSPRYSEIIDRHLSNYWSQIEAPAKEETEDSSDQNTEGEALEINTQTDEEADSEPAQPAAGTDDEQGETTEEVTTMEATEEVDEVVEQPVLDSQIQDSQNPLDQQETEETTDAPATTVDEDEPEPVEETVVDTANEPESESAEPNPAAPAAENSPQPAPPATTASDTADGNEPDPAEHSAEQNSADTTEQNDAVVEKSAMEKPASQDSEAAEAIDSDSTETAAAIGTGNSDVVIDQTESATEPADGEAVDQKISDDSEPQENTEPTSKRCKTLPYICRMFGLD